MENSQHIKSVNTDSRAKNSIRYASARQRAKRASADVYHSYKRRIGVTSAASREERVHHPYQEESVRRKKRHKKTSSGGGDNRVAILADQYLAESDGSSSDLDAESTFADELDLAHDRNASEIFTKFHREIWHLVRSLPEVLHHAPAIVELLMSYLLSPESDRGIKSPGPFSIENSSTATTVSQRETFVVNHATTDVLHLIAVLARDLRHEIHPYLHTIIVPRILYDLLNPPVSTDRQPIPLDVTIVEAAFRTLSYVFRYDMASLLSETSANDKRNDPCLEPMRRYYGVTLAHKNQYVRRLAAETFAPLIRKLKSDSSRKRHLKRVIRALDASSNTQPRARADAVDGVAFLLFQTARGVPGRLHSKGSVIVKCVLDCTVGSKKDGVICEIAAEFLEKLMRHLNNLDCVWKELFKTIDGLETENPEREKPSQADALFNFLRLLERSVSFRNGFFLQTSPKTGKSIYVTKLFRMLERLLSIHAFKNLSLDEQTGTLTLLCSSWKALPDGFASQLSRLLPAVLSRSSKAGSNHAHLLAQDLLPYLPRDVAMKHVGTAILLAASQRARQDSDSSLILVHAVATAPLSANDFVDEDEDDNDSMFFVENANDCDISLQDQMVLLDLCLVDAKAMRIHGKRLALAKVGYACRCVPFVALVGERDQGGEKEVLRKVTKWVHSTLTQLDKDFVTSALSSSEADGFDEMDIVAAKSLVLEALATIASAFSQRQADTILLKKALSRSKPIALDLLLSYPSSIWAAKSVAALVQAMNLYGLELDDSQEDVFDALIPNLRNESHFSRLHSLHILNSYPTKPFVTDHADLDLTDDLDEEPNSSVVQAVQKPKQVSGPCDILATLLRAESVPVNFKNERRITSLITRVEVLGRTGRLPVAYAEAASSHMFGLLYTKFSPIWPAAVRALVALASSHEECAWPSIHAMLEKVIVPSSSDMEESRRSTKNEGSNLDDFMAHHYNCVAWDKSGGSDARLFAGQVKAAQNDGRVSRHHYTDSSTIFELVWSVMEGIPQVTTKKSRVIVPIFLGFLHLQYYVFHDNDPDAREFRLSEQVEATPSWTCEVLYRKPLQRKLSSFLKMFAAVNGPRQLYRHSLLLSIFSAFLSHQDAGTAQLALSCVLKFKLPYVMPYEDYLRNMLKKGELRTSLVQFDLSRETGLVDSEHRESLIPLVSRILFGRLSARVSGGKSSKDSPAARRAAVLSFLSVLGENDHELDPFIYLMVRSFIPAGISLPSVDKLSVEDRTNVIVAIQSVKAHDVSGISRQRQEGFLNLLADVISKLGYGIKRYVSTFMSLVLALSELSEVGKLTEKGDESFGIERIEGKAEDILDSSSSLGRAGVIRTLCFRRLKEILDKFAASYDFTEHTPRMWSATASSISMLPGTVVNAEKEPALLSLLVTISSHQRLIPMLSAHTESVESVIKCIANTSRKQVIDASLSFVDNLLTNGETDSGSDSIEYGSEGVEIIRNHIPLLMQQFTDRLSSADRMNKTDPSTWRELSILCRVSDVVVHEEESVSVREDCESAKVEVLTSLCGLLIPFLGHETRASEIDRLNVLGILNSILPKVESEIALSHLPALSRVLGPHKAGSGITSLSVRQAAASVISTIAHKDEVDENLINVSMVLTKLCATHTKRVDEVDYDQLIPALNGLGEAKGTNLGWLHLAGCGDKNCSGQHGSPHTAFLSPLIYTCFHLLFDEDGVVSRGALKALKTLISLASQQAAKELNTDVRSEEVVRQNQWVMLVEKSIVPSIRTGLSASAQSVRRYFILLLASVAGCFRNYTSPNLYGDLSCLLRTDDQELDFFLNITHVQIHRRSRALLRLRKLLNSQDSTDDHEPFTLQSLSNVLLPLAMHPVYECKAKTEESYALEAIATIGAIGKCLSWNKYHNALWTALTQFSRHPQQERYLIGMICSLIDSFHFQVVGSNELSGYKHSPGSAAASSSASHGSAVWRALDKRIIPKLESILTKEKVDRSGTKVKTLRSAVVLAMMKLFRKFPVTFFEAKLPRLLALICDALKNHDSDARDVARSTLAKMSAEIDMEYLSDVVRELAITLTEGYQLHVRSATLHSILLEISKYYTGTPNGSQEATTVPPFDRCVPAMMDLIQQDLFGEATERKNAEGVQTRTVKEASGAKSIDSIELICRMLLFKPSLASRNGISGDRTTLSSVHAVVSPLLERLREPDVSTSTIGKIRECLNRVVVGLSHNSSAESQEIFPFIYASIEPFIGAYSLVVTGRNDTSPDDYDSSDDETGMKPIHVSKSCRMYASPTNDRKHPGSFENKSTVVEWRPSTLNTSRNEGDALEKKMKERRLLGKVEDGASAPKLTGSSRYASMTTSSTQGLNDPAGISAVVFGLSFLHSVLKRTRRDSQDTRMLSMMDPFIPILTTCVCVCRDNDVILLSLRCLGSLLRMDLPSVPSCSMILGSKTLDLLTSSGALSNLHHELTQGCFKTLTLLFKSDKERPDESAEKKQSQEHGRILSEGVKAVANSRKIPLDSEQMQVLVSLLQAAVVDSEHHNSTFSLIKAISSHRFVSPEFYDLMETILQLSVRSQKPTVRQQSSLIVMHYLVDYPMGKQRLEGHLKQIVLNTKYDYEDGRLSAIGLVTAVIEKLPLPLLEEYAQLFFLPLVLQLVNDESMECREAVAKCLSRLLSRASVDVVQSFYDYAVRWSQGTGNLQRTSLQLFGMFVDTRLDFMKRGNNAEELIDRVHLHLKRSAGADVGEWEVPYFSLVCLEKLSVPFATQVAQRTDLWMVIVECLVNPHPWVKQLSSRIVGSHLGSMDATTFAEDKPETFLLKEPGSLFELAQNLCAQLNVGEVEQNRELSNISIKSLTWIVQAMHEHPHLCFAEDQVGPKEEDPQQARKCPVAWLMTRLSNMAKPKGWRRRENVFKCFAAFTEYGGSIVSPYLELMLEPLHRSIVETENIAGYTNRSNSVSLSVEEGNLAKDVLQLLEDQCGTDIFLEAYASVKIRARQKREERKQHLATEAVQDPQAAATRKMKKHQSERKRRKRKVEERRAQRGATAKRRHID